MYPLIKLRRYMLSTRATNVEIFLFCIHPSLTLYWNNRNIVIHERSNANLKRNVCLDQWATRGFDLASKNRMKKPEFAANYPENMSACLQLKLALHLYLSCHIGLKVFQHFDIPTSCLVCIFKIVFKHHLPFTSVSELGNMNQTTLE